MQRTTNLVKPLNLRMEAQTAARYEDILHTSPSRGRVAGTAVCSQYEPDQSMGPGGLATPETGGRLRAPPQQADRR
jgi:hypothetical protein